MSDREYTSSDKGFVCPHCGHWDRESYKYDGHGVNWWFTIACSNCKNKFEVRIIPRIEYHSEILEDTEDEP